MTMTMMIVVVVVNKLVVKHSKYDTAVQYSDAVQSVININRSAITPTLSSIADYILCYCVNTLMMNDIICDDCLVDPHDIIYDK